MTSHSRRKSQRGLSLMSLLLVTSATSILTCMAKSSASFKRNGKAVPITNIRPQYNNLIQVEKLKDKILRGLNLTAEPEPPTKKPVQPFSSVLNRLPLPRNRTRTRSPVPDTIVWSEPVAMSKSKADQLLFRVNSQKDKSAVINRVTLLVRLRFKHYSKTKRKKKVKGKTRTKDGGDKNKAADIKDKGAKNDGRKGRGRKKGGSKRKKNNSKSRRKKSRRVKILVQARTERKGKFRRVVVQRVSVSKKFNWIKVPIPVSYVSRAAQSANHSLVLRVRCKRCSKSGVSIDNALPRKKSQKSDVDSSAFLNLNPNRPYMVICTADSPLTTLAPAPAPLPRSARHVDKVCPSQSQPEFSCCAEHVEVTFEDLGWDYWIVHPKGFTTVICGVCQTVSNDQDMESDENDVSSSKRKLRQQEQKSLFSGQRLGDESAKDNDDDDSRVIDERQLEMCHPKERSSLTLMYYRDHNTLVRTTIPQLLTKSCACSLSH